MYTQSVIPYQCPKCFQTIYSYFHNCIYQLPETYQGYTYTFTGKQLSEFSLEELLNELKRRKEQQDLKVKELEKEVELQKKLDKMFEEN